MKNCPKCGAPLNDEAVFCTNCGTSVGGQGGPQPQNQYYNQYQQPTMVMPYDHTAEFDPRDIAENKVICMVVYLLGIVGVIIAMLASSSSPYVAFHVRQALKFTVVETLLGVIALVLAVTIIVPIAAGIMIIVLFVVKIICFVQICCNQAKEPVIIRSLPFLK